MIRSSLRGKRKNRICTGTTEQGVQLRCRDGAHFFVVNCMITIVIPQFLYLVTMLGPSGASWWSLPASISESATGRFCSCVDASASLSACSEVIPVSQNSEPTWLCALQFRAMCEYGLLWINIPRSTRQTLSTYHTQQPTCDRKSTQSSCHINWRAKGAQDPSAESSV